LRRGVVVGIVAPRRRMRLMGKTLACLDRWFKSTMRSDASVVAREATAADAPATYDASMQ
jgi:hypothetical protein